MFQFPPNPAVGQTFNPVAGVTFRWNGTAWFLLAGPGAFISQAEADLRYVELSDPRPPVNAIINGDFRVWQRGTAFVGALAGTYWADRWAYTKIGSAVHNLTNGPAAPSVAQAGRLFVGGGLVQCTTAQGVMAAGDLLLLYQAIEGYNWSALAQRPCVLSFWVLSSKTGVHTVSLRSGVGDRSCVAEYVVHAVNNWERKVVTFPASPSAGTWNYANGTGCLVSFTLAAGSTFQTAPNVWQAGNFISTANQVNLCDNTANVFSLQGVDLRPGTEAPAVFESRPFAEELALCQRYYSKSYDLNGIPGSTATNGVLQGISYSNNFFNVACVFPTRMRALPTLTFYSPGDGAAGFVLANGPNANIAASLQWAGETGFTVAANFGSAGRFGQFQYAANAEL
jgi:hypothetical protein